ncbi:MAG TPA: hypothetical protein VNN07_10675 [Candidatus Tectomicrobia bacterium]|nr:hypothetical protein [Candidatus Tectomicrobia bacterium]
MPATIAVANTNEDIVELLRLALEERGFATVRLHVDDIKRGRTDFVEFLERHDPAAFVYDVPPPYEENWIFLRLLRHVTGMRGRPVIVTTTHRPNLEKLVGPTDAIEIIGKPNDGEEAVQAVVRALGERGRRPAGE